MSEERHFPSASHENLVVPFEGYDGLEVAIHQGPEVVGGPQPTNDFEKYPTLEPKPLSGWKRRKFGHSIRFWILVTTGILILIAVVGGTVAGVTAGHKHGSTTTSALDDQNNTITPTSSSPSSTKSPSTKLPPTSTTKAPSATSTPVENVEVPNCPALNKQIFNTSSTDKEYTFQFMKYCNKTATANSVNIFQITPSPTTGASSSSTPFSNPSTVTSFGSCIANCVAYSRDYTSGTDPPICFGASFDANQTARPTGNCYLYAISNNGNFTAAQILTASGPLTAIGVMVSFDTFSYVGSVLSDNGDWAGGIS